MTQEEAGCKYLLSLLLQLDTPTLRDEWVKWFGQPAPKYLSRDMLTRAISYRIQEQEQGGLRPATLQRLRRLAKDLHTGKVTKTALIPTPQPGVRLMREWNGKTHIVEVLPDGFLWRDTKHASHSAVARATTGSRWSGPRFFGLLTRRKADAGTWWQENTGPRS